MIYILILISIYLDGLLTIYLASFFNNLSIFTPLFTLITIGILGFNLKDKKNKYLTISFVVGLIYDLLYTNILFLNSFLFLIIALITIRIINRYSFNFFKLIIYLLTVIIVYEFIYFLLIIIIYPKIYTPIDLIYKISHSLLLNIVYGEFLYFLLEKYGHVEKSLY